MKEPPTRQLGQVLPFRSRQLGVLIHLFCSSLPSHMLLLGWFCSVLAPGPSATAPSVWCTLPALLWSSGTERQLLALGAGHSLLGRLVLSTQTSAMWVMGELPGAAAWGMVGNLSS